MDGILKDKIAIVNDSSADEDIMERTRIDWLKWRGQVLLVKGKFYRI